ncbi:MAG: SpoIIE family protein phosphatase, partial [Actinomycetota bacterium]|nr:SpoIIE family protein phosphatase [Actinomycetota bacterium]
IPIDEHLGRSVDDVFLGLELKIGTHLFDVLATKEPVLDIELSAVPRNSREERCWRTSFYPVMDNGHVGQLGVVFTDVTDLRRAERERADLLERERTARRDAERVGDQVALLAGAMVALSDTMHLDRSLGRFLAGLVPQMADWCAIDVVDERGRLRRVDSTAMEPALLEWVRRAERELATDPSQSPAEAVFEAEQAVLVAELTDELLSEMAVSERHLAAGRAAGFRSLMMTPVKARGRTIGVLSMARVQQSSPFGEDDLALALDLASRAGLAIDNARLYAQEHHVARTLQLALLPPAVPIIDGLEICVQYQPGSDGVEVGGDWYDVVKLEDGSVALSIGDVVGHDLAAAVRMSELRTVLRAETAPDSAYARSPATSVDRLDRFAREYGTGYVATLLHGVLDPRTGLFTYVRAGHLPLAIVGHDKSVRFVDDDGSPPLGLGLGAIDRIDSTVVIPCGATLVLYTDGLIERRGETIDDGFRRLVDWLAGAADPLQGWCDQLLDDLAPAATTADDVAVLLARRT